MKPQLPDGLVAIVKRECATCVMVDPLFANIAASGTPLTVYTQDDPTFPASVSAIHDADLSVSWHYDIETVPTLLRIENGEEADRTFGWSKEAWQKFTGITDLGADLPVMRPGCGSLSVDPNLEDELRVRFTSSTLHSRHVELASAEDEFESMFTRGWTDGLPVIPPTPERVLRMLTGTTRSPQDIVAIAPPNLVELTIEKIAINAVMAGALPEYLPWIITALEAVCNDEFNMHGVLATTMPVGPVIICNGPGTKAIGMNSGVNVFGQGNRANLTIGRAVQLTIRNVGGGKPGEVDRATHGNPGKLSFCFAEDEAGSPFGTLAQERGIAPQQNAVTVFAGEGPRCVVDQAARTPEQLTNSFAACLRATHHPKSVLSYDAILVVSPDHSRVYAEAGWDREKILSELYARLNIPGTELVKGAHDMAEGLPAKFADRIVPKFKAGGILLAHAGGGAGLFSSIIGGWANGAMGSTPVTRPVIS
ncbi:MAG: thioredoxin family protein [Ilumatobacteraceae bacterium]|nr:thioredoxin family protein [Ilumatobacteraceae bacterium]